MKNIESFKDDFLDDFFNLSDEKLEINKKTTTSIMKYIYKHIVANKKILIIGDKDVDGMLSAIQLSPYLKLLELRVNGRTESKIDTFYNKRKLGYELPKAKFDAFQEEYDLLIFLDTGSSYSYFSPETKKTIVIDHHQTDKSIDSMPWIFNPNADNSISTSCGRVVYEMIESFESDMREYFGKDKIKPHDILKINKMLAGITVCSDMARMSHDNKIFLKEALDLMSDNKASLLWLKDIKNKDISALDISFNLINKINSYSRMGRDLKEIENVFKFNLDLENIKAPLSSRAILLLIDKMDSIHKERKDIYSCLENQLLDNLAKSDIEKSDCHISIIDNEYSGINGLLSQTILNTYLKSNIVVSYDKDKNLYVGSGRGAFARKSLEMLKDNKELADKFNFGGHDMAVGITIEKDAIHSLVKEYNKLIIPNANTKEDENIRVYKCDSIEDFKKANDYYSNLSPTTLVDKKYFAYIDSYKNLGIVEKSNWYNATITDGTAMVMLYFKKNNIEKIKNNKPIVLEIKNTNSIEFLQNIKINNIGVEADVSNEIEKEMSKEIIDDMNQYFMEMGK